MRPTASTRSDLEEFGPYAALRHDFRVMSNIPETGTVLPRLMRPFAGARPTDGRPGVTYELLVGTPAGVPYELFRDGASIQRVASAGSMLDWLIADVGSRALMGADEVVAVHAGVVSRLGQGLLLPAPPDHGKTTTVLGLAATGWDVLSDEAALIVPGSGLVESFPRPFMASEESLALLPHVRAGLPPEYEVFRKERFHLTVEDIPGARWGTPCAVRFVVAPEYRRGGRTKLLPMSRAEALTLLMDQCFNVGAFGARAVEVLADVLRGADCYRLAIADLPSAIAAIEGLVHATDIAV